jgi:hypothetical protein
MRDDIVIRLCDECLDNDEKQIAFYFCDNCSNVFCEKCYSDGEYGRCPHCAPALLPITKEILLKKKKVNNG